MTLVNTSSFQLIKERLHPRFWSNPRNISDLEPHDSFDQAARYDPEPMQHRR